MITKDDIKFNPISFWDPVGRVFFAKGRVFRAITKEYADDAKQFLCSDLYKELRKREWLVKTWISNDVQLDEYPLVLEHEKLFYVPCALWTFNQWKDAARLTLMVRDYCVSKNGELRDSRTNNIAFKNGKPILLDFGSFLFHERSNVTSWDRLYYYTFYRALYHAERREPFMAQAWADNASYYYEEKLLVPYNSLENSVAYSSIYSPVVKYYDVFIRQRYPHFRIYTETIRFIVERVNIIFRKCLHKDQAWSLFKKNIVFKKPNLKIFDRFREPYRPNQSLDAIVYHDDFITKELGNVLSLKNIDKIMLYGPFEIDDILKVREIFEGEIIVAYKNDTYVDLLYKYLGSQNINIHVVLYNLFLEQNEIINKYMHVDLLCLHESADILFPVGSSLIKIQNQCSSILTRNELIHSYQDKINSRTACL